MANVPLYEMLDDAEMGWLNGPDGFARTDATTATFSGSLIVSTGTLGATLSTAAQPNITSLGTLTALTVDNLGIDGNSITSSSGDIAITPVAGGNTVISGDAIALGSSWYFADDGTLYPTADATYDIGSSTYQVRSGYFETITTKEGNLTLNPVAEVVSEKSVTIDAAQSLTVATIEAAADLTLNPTGDVVLTTDVYHADLFRFRETGRASGAPRQYLFMDQSDWETDNSAVISGANNFHFYARGETRCEFESNDDIAFYIEGGTDKEAFFGIQEAATHHWSWGVDADVDKNLAFCVGFGLAGTQPFSISKTGNATALLSVTTPLITAPSDLTLNPSGDVVILDEVIVRNTAVTVGVHLGSTTHRDVLIEANSDAVLQLASSNLGTVGTAIVLTGMEAADDGRHWIIEHTGTSESNQFGIGYVTSAASGENIVGTVTPDFTISTDGVVDVPASITSGGVAVGGASGASPLHIYENTATTLSTTGLTVEQDGTGDAVMNFYLTGTRRWYMGCDNSASDSFAISSGSSGLSDNPALKIEPTGDLTLSPALDVVLTPTGGDVTITGNVAATSKPFASVSNSTTVVANNQIGLVEVANTADSTQGGLSARGSTHAGTFLGSSGKYIELSANTNALGLKVGTIGNAPLIFGTANTEQVRIDNSGNVGIGTASPSAELDVVGDVAISGELDVDTITAAGDLTLDPGSGGSVVVTYPSAGIVAPLKIENTTGGASSQTVVNVKCGTAQSQIRQYSDTHSTDPDLLKIISPGDVMLDPGTGTVAITDTLDVDTITASGDLTLSPAGANVIISASKNLGVGTSSPDGLLHIYGGSSGATANSLADNIILETNSDTGISILSPDSKYSSIYLGSGTDAIGAQIQWKYDNDLFAIGSHKTNAEVQIKSGNGVEAIRIDENQNVDVVGGDLQINGNLDFDAAATIGTDAGDLTLAPASGNNVVVSNGANGVIQLESDTTTMGDNSVIGKLNFYGNDVSAPGAGIKGQIGVYAISDGATAGNAAYMAFTTSGGAADGNNVERLRIDKDGNVGIGTASPAAELHIYNAAAGGAAPATTDKLVVENNTDAYVNFLTPNTNTSGILFSDNTRAKSKITYGHSTNTLAVLSGGPLTITSGGASPITLVPASGVVDVNGDLAVDTITDYSGGDLTLSPANDVRVTGAVDMIFDNNRGVMVKTAGGSDRYAFYVDNGDDVKIGSNSYDDIVFSVGALPNAIKFEQTTGNIAFQQASAITTASGDLTLSPASNLVLSGLPTSDPTSAGAVWNDSGTLKISSG